MTTGGIRYDKQEYAQRIAAMRALYDSLPEGERAQIDAACTRLAERVPLMGPLLAFETVMSVRLLAARMAT